VAEALVAMAGENALAGAKERGLAGEGEGAGERARPRARARDGLDRTPGRARARVGRAPACRPGSNTCARVLCPSSGACGRPSEPALALVSAQNLFSSLQATNLVGGS
jgi:hypothetical protein